MRLERLDVRVKIVSFIAVTTAVLMITHPLGNLILVIVLLAALRAAGTPLKGVWRMLQPLLLLFALIVAVAMVSSTQFTLVENTRVLFSLWGIRASLGGLLVGLNFVVRILAMVFATYAFTISTPIDDLLIVMSDLHFPYGLSILVTTAISFIPTLAHRKDLIIEAQRARGARVKDKGPIGQVVAVVPIMVPLITNSILIADNLAVAMTNRGYGANPSMTAMRDLTFRRSDALVLAAVTAVLLSVAWLRYGLGYGVV
ncbi:MAG: energy-coupling factor transporter transmembrane component T family protein [Propionicimonas sp.]